MEFAKKPSSNVDNGINEDAQIRSKKENPWWAPITGTLLILLSIILIFTSIITIYDYVYYSKTMKSANWPSVSGKVITSDIERYDSYDGMGGVDDNYCAEVSYKYSVGGKTYYGNIIRFTGYCYESIYRAKEDTDLYSDGKNVLVFYDPAKPKDSVLEPGWTVWSSISTILSYSIPGVIGFYLIISYLRNKYFM